MKKKKKKTQDAVQVIRHELAHLRQFGIILGSVLTIGLTFAAIDSIGSARVVSACSGLEALDLPPSALLGKWQETELSELRTEDGLGYWVKRDHVLTREGQLTTREEICADATCFEPKAEFVHFGTFEFDAAQGKVEKNYRKHFFTAMDTDWVKAAFKGATCVAAATRGQVVSVEDENCLKRLNVRAGNDWALSGATLKSLAFKDCGSALRADAQVTREMVRMF